MYVDSVAVRAALLGRVLIIDGLEKAERKVLPVINNLLENREMALEDGRFIVSPARYVELVDQHGAATVKEWNLVSAHPEFIVIAIGLPSPPYFGNPLDPPLRSRFQARTAGTLSVSAQLLEVRKIAPHLNSSILVRLISVARVIQEMHKDAQDGVIIPDFPHALLEVAARILDGCKREHLGSSDSSFDMLWGFATLSRSWIGFT